MHPVKPCEVRPSAIEPWPGIGVNTNKTHKSMKKLMMIAFAVVLAHGAMAQDDRTRDPKEGARMRAERMTKELRLDDDQAARLEAYFLREAERMQAERQERERELKAILGEEKFAEWKANRQARREKAGDRAHPHKPAR